MRDTLLFKKVAGYLVGAAIGDAHGVRVENMHYKDIERQYGRLDGFDQLPKRETSTQPPLERYHPLGQSPWAVEGGFHPLGRWSDDAGAYTDDMRYRLLLCHAILRKGGPVDGQDFAEEWLNFRLMAEGAAEYRPTLSWSGPQRGYARILGSVQSIGTIYNSHRPASAAWDGPIGLIHAGDPEGAAMHGYVMAVGVATALRPDATLDTMVASMIEHASVLSGPRGDSMIGTEFVGRVQKLLGIAKGCRDAYDLREPFYREFLVTFPPWRVAFILEMIPAAIAVCAIAGKDGRHAVAAASSLGRDADSIACMAGELVGALHGIDAFPKDWVERVLETNPEPDLMDLAERLCELIMARARVSKERSEALLSMAR